MKPEPLKGKALRWDYYKKQHFAGIDIQSAVEWLKEELANIEKPNNIDAFMLIDKAFEDVMRTGFQSLPKNSEVMKDE